MRLKHPDLAEVYYERGRVYKDKKNVDQAIREYTESIRLDTVMVKAYQHRISMYRLKGGSKGAE